jgi:hypothetical protein
MMKAWDEQAREALAVMEEWYRRLPDNDRAWLAGTMSTLRTALRKEKKNGR